MPLEVRGSKFLLELICINCEQLVLVMGKKCPFTRAVPSWVGVVVLAFKPLIPAFGRQVDL